ncbi:linker histone H1M [Denticeps clupeoides]|uniref:linker histone H1M n=1 Tax=Denticeps clupeoides TaxID=299321 RepID=UPI0010A59626|nr:protein B4-like [Denticeps clupeoides]
MGPKKVVAKADEVPSPEVTEEAVKGKTDDLKSDKPVGVRKVSAHPPTMVMVKEALKELDSRKGVSVQAVRGYITEKYQTVDAIRLKYMVRRALLKGLETGAIVRPANSTTTGVQGRFRLAARNKPKEPKAKENSNPNIEKAPASAKDKEPKTKETGAQKPKQSGKKEKNSTEDSQSKPAQEKASKGVAAAAKKPKAKRSAEGGEEEAKPKTKAAKASKVTTKPEAEPVVLKKAKKTKNQEASEDGGDETATAPAKSKGRRGKKAV